MAGESSYSAHDAGEDNWCPKERQQQFTGYLKGASSSSSASSSPFFEMICGSLYRKKLERGQVQYREVLAEDKRFQLINAFHVKTPGTLHHTLDDTYRLVAEHYWWEEMYFQVRDFVLGCNECHKKAECLDVGNVSKVVKSHSHEVLSKLNSQREKGLFCDVTLKTGSGHSFVAHKAVLAAVSEYFQELFTEMDSAAEPLPHVDLTDYNEESLLTLLEFSYTSILTLNLNTLAEVAAMARHLRMWPALEACSAFQHEEVTGEQFPKLVKPVGVSSGNSPINSWRNQHCAFRTTTGFKRKRDKQQEEEDAMLFGSSIMADIANTVEVSDGNSYFAQSLASPCQNQASFSLLPGYSFPCSPTRRMKLMDFKSPSSKRKPSPRPSPSVISSPSTSTRSSSPSRRLLRSTPGAALALRRLLPKIDLTTKRKRKTSSYSRAYRDRVKPDLSAEHARSLSTPETPVKIKQEKEEEDICSVVPQDEVHSPRAQEKYRLLSFLGLQRKSLVPGPEEHSGWGQKKRLRKLKVSDYSLTARRKPRTKSQGGYATNLRGFVGVSSSLSLCDMTRMDLLSKVIKVEPQVSPKNSTKKRDRSGQAACVGVRTTRSQTLQKGCMDAIPNRPLRSHSRHPSNLLPQPKGAKRDRIPRHGAHPNKATLKTKPEPKDYAISQLGLSCTSPCKNPRVSPPGTKVSTSKNGSQVQQPLTITNTGAKPMVHYSSKCTTVKHKNTRQTMSGKESASCHYKNVTNDLQPELSGHCSGKQTGKNKKNKARRKARDEKVENLMGENSWNVPNTNDQHYSNPLYKAIKEEPADPVPLTQALLTSDSSELGKRQSKPPIKLLDQGFLFDLCRPPCGIKREEESVDIYLTRSVSHSSTSHSNTSPSVVRRDRIKARLMSDGSGLNGPHWTGIGNRATSQRILFRVKMEEDMTAVSKQSRTIRGPTKLTDGKKNCKHTPKTKNVNKLNKLYPVRSQPTMLESIRRVQHNQLKGCRGLSSGGVHSCLQCKTSYRDCDDLIMHRIRHIEGKHWPCPLCSKTFFRELNVKNHIRTHNPKLYKCKQCITAS